MDFNTAWNIVRTDLTPQPWDHTTADGTTLRIIPAGLRDEPGCAEVLIRITGPNAAGLAEFGITTPDSRDVAEVGVPTATLPALITALTDRTGWENTGLPDGRIAVIPGVPGVAVSVTEAHSVGREVTVTVCLPEAQRMPLTSALARALDVARGWES